VACYLPPRWPLQLLQEGRDVLAPVFQALLCDFAAAVAAAAAAALCRSVSYRAMYVTAAAKGGTRWYNSSGN
jgi:hypothetical protein